MSNSQISADEWVRPTTARRVRRDWYRGPGMNFLPNRAHLHREEAAAEYVLQGWTPAQPEISRSTIVTAFGSCFARHISDWLSERQYAVSTSSGASYLVSHAEGFVNSFSILGQFEWALENRKPGGEFWHDKNAETLRADETLRAETERILRSSDIFIITLGLSEIWYDEPTGEVFWRAVPAAQFNPSRHKFRVASVEENAQNLRRICELIIRHMPGAKIIFTLSPIPLVATFRRESCITANAVSKATLRVAIDLVVSEHDQSVYYWPAYEIVKEFFFDPYRADARHIKRPILDYIMSLFERAWCTDTPSDRDLSRLLWRARVADRRSKTHLPWQSRRKLIVASLELTASRFHSWITKRGRKATHEIEEES